MNRPIARGPRHQRRQPIEERRLPRFVKHEWPPVYRNCGLVRQRRRQLSKLPGTLIALSHRQRPPIGMREIRWPDPVEFPRQRCKPHRFVNFPRDGIRCARQCAPVAPVLYPREMGVLVPAFPHRQHRRVEGASDEKQCPENPDARWQEAMIAAWHSPQTRSP